MSLIAESGQLAGFCERLSGAEFVAVDTEFMRDRTYWPQLCLVQMAGPDDAAVIDALAPGLDLSPVLRLMDDSRILKVFHAGRQDLEIFYLVMHRVPAPLFDTQVAAMVCGFGDAASYETLAGRLAGVRIDKSVRFTDWAARPLSERQIAYALADVVHLRAVYLALARRLGAGGRAQWLTEEMATLLDPATYRFDPEEAWRRLHSRAAKPRFLAVLREVAAWREREAQGRDTPRNWVLRDEWVMDIAAHAPTSRDALSRLRGLSKGFAESRAGEDVLAAVARGLAVPESELPPAPPRTEKPAGLGPVVELLKVLLKMKCEVHDVAPKLVASTSDLEAIAANDAAQVPALHGWRREVFGEDALALKAGKLAFTAHGKHLVLVPTAQPEAPESARIRA
ncbi:MAG: ribonuclease D [Pseudomonadota bacterium]